MVDKDKFIAQIQRFYKNHKSFILLESQMNDHSSSNDTFIAIGIEASLTTWGTEIRRFKDGIETVSINNPWTALREFRTEYKEWCFGILGYDLKNYVEKLSSNNKRILETPDMVFIVPEILIKVGKKNNIEWLKGDRPLDLPNTTMERGIDLTLESQTLKSRYLEKINLAQKYIKEGDFYEINLSHPMEYKFEGEAWDLYQKMKALGPVPFGSYIRINDIEICSASPERFLSKKGKKIYSQPIKGTISRSEINDKDSIEALLNSEKERAENLMIVDLVRNDLSRVSEEGSVKVSNLFEIQSFETVHQMVSTIESEAHGGIHSVDIIKACFPMGSMTGAPKVAAMKAIEELEDYSRGIYSGAIGYFTPYDDFDFSVVIRTAIVENDQVIYPVGGAITSDSDPELEWEETLVKAQAITRLIN
jgi:para-aminobenzoate synthetase component 1